MYDSGDHELPQELLLSIQRVLEINDTEQDPLDVLSNDIDTVRVLNTFFPDGKSHAHTPSIRFNGLCTEASLGQINVVQEQLAENQRQMKRDIVQLEAELKRDQDPNRMQLIQEMISVCG